MQVDALHSTRPIEYEVLSPDDTHGDVRRAHVRKGRLGAAHARAVPRRRRSFATAFACTCSKHSYANATTTDLWDALEENSGQPVRTIMDTWILQGGVPLVTLEADASPSDPSATPAKSDESAIGDHWLVPVQDPFARRRRTVAPPPRRRRHQRHRRLPVVVNAGGSGDFRSRYGATKRARGRSHRASATSKSSSARRCSRTTRRRCSPTRSPGRSFSPLRAGSATRTSPTPGSPSPPALTWSIARSTTTSARRFDASCARSLPPARATRLGSAARRGRARPPAARSWSISTLGRSARTRTCAKRRYAALRPIEMDGDIAQSILRVVASQDRPGDYETFLERHRHAATPQEDMRYLSRPRRVPRRGDRPRRR